jgi:TonB C terminal
LADSFETSRELTTTDDVVEAQRLQKVYVGQISARLRRVLEELRATPSAPAACLVNVVQDERGGVLDVLMDQCEADQTWREMVSRAIRQSSPLPLPPQGLAMGSYLMLDVSNVLTQIAGTEILHGD